MQLYPRRLIPTKIIDRNTDYGRNSGVPVGRRCTLRAVRDNAVGPCLCWRLSLSWHHGRRTKTFNRFQQLFIHSWLTLQLWHRQSLTAGPKPECPIFALSPTNWLSALFKFSTRLPKLTNSVLLRCLVRPVTSVHYDGGSFILIYGPCAWVPATRDLREAAPWTGFKRTVVIRCIMR